MAKIRVYELAKKLNLTNKALLTKLEAMNIEVKSHMSSLEDETVIQIRENLFGKKNKLSDTRVRSSVIRRRKVKKPKVSPEPTMDENAVSPTGEAEEPIIEKETKPPEVPEKAIDDKAPDTRISHPIQEASKERAKIIKPVSEAVLSVKSEKIIQEKPEVDEEPSPIKEEPSEEIKTKPVSKEAPVETEPDVESVTEQQKTPEKPDVESVTEQQKTPEKPDVEPVTEQQKIPEKPDVGAEKGKEADKEKALPVSKDKKRKKKKTNKTIKKAEPAKIIKMVTPASLKPPGRKEKDTSGRAGKPTRRSGATPNKTRKKPVRRPADHRRPAAVMPNNAEQKPDSRSKRKKTKKRRGVGDGNAGDMPRRGGFRKRKSVVEGKDLYDRGRGGKRGRRKDNRSKRAQAQKTQITVPKAIKRRVKIDETIELAELAKRMGIKANEMIVKLMGLGVMATVNQTIDYDTASLVAAEFDYEVEKASFEEEIFTTARDMQDDDDKMIARPPVVTIMGHVDHGKTSLLDVIRKSKITTGEAGGITQHIGAYSVETGSGVITFLDTPGHAAFTSMRSRGAKVTDLVVLVVAADDGVMPQTIEAINHSKAADVPVVVAVNKMDKPGADPDRVMRELSEHGLVAEDWGGDVIFAKVSAKAETGIDDLLEMILLQSEVLELKANPDRLATGHVVEARLDAGRGPVATILVEQGTLKAGQPVVCGLHSGRIRAMIGDTGANIENAGPSTPVEIVGLSGVPVAGDEVVALDSEKDAKQISSLRMQKQRAKELAKKSRANLEKLFENMGSDEIKELKLIVKADVHGSIEALNESIMKLTQEEVDITIVHSGTGAINESDVSLAAVSDAIIIGFNVRPTPKVRAMAKEENVDMRFYDIIYNVINDIKAAITGLMPSTFHEMILGRADVREVFVIPSKGTIAGSFVQDGKFVRGDKVRLIRDGVVKCDSTIISMRRFKDDVKEVVQGYECGIGIDRYNDIKAGDVLECYEVEERQAKMEQIKE